MLIVHHDAMFLYTPLSPSDPVIFHFFIFDFKLILEYLLACKLYTPYTLSK